MRPEKTVTQSRLSTTTLMTPELANFAGNIHGGHILRLVDQIAYACGASYSGHYCVTLSVDRVLFKVPVQVGDLVTMKAQVNRAGRTSMEIGVRVEARDLREGDTRHTNSCFLTMVAMRDGKPQVVPKLVPETEQDFRRNDQALRRLEQSRLEDQVAANRVRYADLLEMGLAPTLIGVAESGEIRRVNQAACKLFGCSREDLAGRQLWSLFDPPQAARAQFAQVNEGVSEFELSSGALLLGAKLKVVAWRIPLPSGSLIHSVLAKR